MTVENTQNKMPPLQMGTTNEYPFNFAVLLQDPTAEEALEAIKASVLQADGTEIELVYNTDYTVTLNTDRIGGTLTVNDIRTSGDYITIYRQYAQTQEVDYKDFNSAPAETFEQCFDKLTMLSQQQQEEINRSLKLNVSSTIIDPSLPEPIANNTLIWDSVGSSLKNYDIIGENNQFKAEVNAAIIAGQADIQAQFEEFENVINTEIEDVREAAEKINELEQAVDDAQAAANSAEASVDEAQILANEAQILANEAQASANEASQLVQNAQTTLNTRANIDLSNLSSVGENKFNTILNNKITNCLLEVPQNIKLELADGVLTLKTGSIVTVPNGFEADGTTPKFDYVTIESDKSTSGSQPTNSVIFVGFGGNALLTRVYSKTVSGAGATTTGGFAYDTQANIINYHTNNGEIGVTNICLPVALAYTDGEGKISSFDTFNGMGYIGSYIWKDKDLVGLSPNGYNNDGTLANIEWKSNKVLGRQFLASSNYTAALFTSQNGTFDYVPINTYEVTKTPSSTCRRYYNPIDNFLYNKENNTRLSGFVYVGTCTLANGQITSFQPKQPFRAVDYQEAVLKDSLQECQVVVETYKNGDSWYRVWSDGWCEQGGYGKGWVTLLKPFMDTYYNTLAVAYTGSNRNVNARTDSKQTTQFYVYAEDSCFWEAKGYIA